MAVQTIRTDDLTGDAGAELVVITVNGRGVEIDLADKSADRLTKALAPFWSVGSEAHYDVTRRTRARNGDGRGYDIDALRRWAADNGVQVPKRGRIPADVVTRYLHR